nr:MAG: hypothetical protein 3 [Leviviridae sp.]
MRKYYTRAGLERSNPYQRINSKELHWETYEALVQGLPDEWRPAMRQRLLLCIAERDIAALSAIISEVDGFTTEYEPTTPLPLVRADRRVVAYLKKFPFSENISPFDCKQNAIEKWRSAEQKCEETNTRLKDTKVYELPKFAIRARKLIADTLGELSPRILNRILDEGSHGPGATLSSRGNRVTPYYKYMDFPYTVTPSAAPYALAAISRNPRWLDILESSGRRRVIPTLTMPQYQKEMQIFSDCVELVNSDRVTFVPKDMKTHRPIAVGASLNVYLQLGVKAVLEDKLKAVGVDLTDQSRNRDMAYQASRYCMVGNVENVNQFSTIDLASASDTISYELVKKLLPSDWFALLCDLRHESGDLDGSTCVYSKFSAMGNGYTFPLESLIFWALAKAAILEDGGVCRVSDIGVFGDDIIIRYKHSSAVISALSWAGFLVNQEKSFLSGPFKESCGADYFMGKNVRPFYLKREVQTYEDVYFICNSVAALADNQKDRTGYSSCYSRAISDIPKGKRRYAPLTSRDDTALQVPLSYMRAKGLAPWLFNDEASHLRARRLLSSEVLGYQSPVYIRSYLIAQPYSGRARVRLMLALQGPACDPEFFRKPHDILVMQATAAGQVTRRKAVIRRTQVASVPNWDGMTTARQRASHFVWDS